jgi:hypothetical protein
MTTLTRQTKVIAATEKRSGVLAGGLRQALKIAGISPARGYRLAAEGKLPFAIRCGGTYIVPRAAFERWLAGELRPENESAAPVESR